MELNCTLINIKHKHAKIQDKSDDYQIIQL